MGFLLSFSSLSPIGNLQPDFFAKWSIRNFELALLCIRITPITSYTRQIIVSLLHLGRVFQYFIAVDHWCFIYIWIESLRDNALVFCYELTEVKFSSLLLFLSLKYFLFCQRNREVKFVFHDTLTWNAFSFKSLFLLLELELKLARQSGVVLYDLLAGPNFVLDVIKSFLKLFFSI